MAESTKPDFTTLTDLASTQIGGLVLFATDEWFAPAQMLLDSSPPVFKEGLFTDYGKWMDGWETRRKRIPGHDWCLLQLGVPGTIYGFEVDTAFFTGNNVPAISIHGALLPDGMPFPEEHVDPGTGAITNTGMMGVAASPGQLTAVTKTWSEVQSFELLPKSPLKAGYQETRLHYFAVKNPQTASHLRINYFPDGGVARLRVYREVKPAPLLSVPRRHDFAAALNGGCALCWSNEHYGTPSNTLNPGRAAKMDEGWETARNPNRPAILELGSDGYVDFSYSNDWFIMRLGMRADIEELEVDTNHFKGNFPESCLIEVCDIPEVLSLPVPEQKAKFNDAAFRSSLQWKPLLKRSKMVPHAQVTFSRNASTHALSEAGAATHARVTIFPDGGISRLRMYGAPAPATPQAKL
jgi:allantoicase